MDRRAFLVGALLVAACKGKGESTTSTTSAASSGDTWTKISKGGSVAEKIKSEVAKTDASLTPIVYIGATWCPPCAAIKKTKTDQRMVDAFAGTKIIELDMDDWDDPDLAALGYKTGAIPVFFAVDKNGKATGKSIDGGAWGDNIPENMAPPLKAFFASVKS